VSAVELTIPPLDSMDHSYRFRRDPACLVGYQRGLPQSFHIPIRYSDPGWRTSILRAVVPRTHAHGSTIISSEHIPSVHCSI
jgi:hypothetical protein